MLEIINPAAIGGGVGAATFAGILAALAIGRWIGRRMLAKYGPVASSSIGSLEAAVFALLGLLIAFTFSGGLTRFDQRRAQAVQEANAIGTAYLRIDLLAPSMQPGLRKTFRDYVDSRIATYRNIADLTSARAELARSQDLQTEIWRQAIEATRASGGHPQAAILVLPALNDMFDITTVRVTATQIHPPLIIYAMLIALAIASALLAGYQSAGEKAIDWVHQIGFAAIIAFTVYVILDLEYPRLGLIRIDAIDQVLVNVRSGMK